ncbi:MAG: hypothetical protein LBH31_04875 [Burkholderiaceae bacterium]|nr:hypothetical protein [Burkholderiaceae bacterium]
MEFPFTKNNVNPIITLDEPGQSRAGDMDVSCATAYGRPANGKKLQLCEPYWQCRERGGCGIAHDVDALEHRQANQTRRTFMRAGRAVF